MQDWNEIGPEFTKKLLEENPDQELEALRTAKTMGDIWQQIAELTESTQTTSALLQQMRKEQAAIEQSQQLQKQRKQKHLLENGKSTLPKKEML